MTVCRSLRLTVLLVLSAFLGLAPLQNAEARILAQWVELGPDGGSSVRAVVDDVCPAVVFDGVAAPMSVRAAPGGQVGNVKPAQFPVRSCEAMVPAGAVAAVLDGKAAAAARGRTRNAS